MLDYLHTGFSMSLSHLRGVAKRPWELPRPSLPGFIGRIGEQLLRYRWWLMILLGLSRIVFEVMEDSQSPNDFDGYFDVELLMFVVGVPLLVGAMLSRLARVGAERARAVQEVELQYQLSKGLTAAKNWDELTSILVQFPSEIVPLGRSSLLTYDPSSAKFELSAEWRNHDGPVRSYPVPIPVGAVCDTCALAHSSSIRTLVPCRCHDMPGMLDPPNGYCLPLVHAGTLVATLHLELLPHLSPSAAQLEILNRIAPSMALAIDNARPRHVAAVCDAAVEAERRRIAQRLHDTLGQNLGYLHLKLDQLTGDNALQEITAIQQELARMRDIANEAYDQVRETLVSLHPASSEDLATAVLAQARSIGDQGGFEVELTGEGQTRPLSPLTQHQILYLIREALINVAKHARAHHVFICLNWAVGNLTIKLADDGQGFEPAAIRPNGHLGLAIMQERALQINGFLKLESSPGLGTEVTLRLPLDAISGP